MNKEQNKQFRMFLSTQDFMDKNNGAWYGIPKANMYKNDLDELIERIKEKSVETENTIGKTERKNSLKDNIVIRLSSISGTLQAYAFENNDMDLVKKVKISKSEAADLIETNLNAKVLSIVAIANEKMNELRDYGLNPESIHELLTSLEEFNGLIGKPKNILSKKFESINTLDLLVDEGRNLLHNKLDKLMLMFRETNTEFYNGYERARTIID